jgi:hypothetical protein
VCAFGQVVFLEAGRVAFLGSAAAFLASSHAHQPAPHPTPAAQRATAGCGSAQPRGAASLPVDPAGSAAGEELGEGERGGALLAAEPGAAALRGSLGDDEEGLPGALQPGTELDAGHVEQLEEQGEEAEPAVGAEAEAAEEREEGHVRWAVWARYCTAVGRRLALAVLVSLALMQVGLAAVPLDEALALVCELWQSLSIGAACVSGLPLAVVPLAGLAVGSLPSPEARPRPHPLLNRS